MFGLLCGYVGDGVCIVLSAYPLGAPGGFVVFASVVWVWLVLVVGVVVCGLVSCMPNGSFWLVLGLWSPGWILQVLMVMCLVVWPGWNTSLPVLVM